MNNFGINKNYQFTDFTLPPPKENDQAEWDINENTTVDEFVEQWKKHPEWSLKEAGKNKSSSLFATFSATPLHYAAFHGNVELIVFLVNLLGKNSLIVRDCAEYIPIDHAMYCKDYDKKYLATRKIMQLGTPINVIFEYTPLESTLWKEGDIKIAAMLLRMGGIVREEIMESVNKDPSCGWRDNLEAARKEALTPTQSEMQFKMGLQGKLPIDILNNILSFSAQLEP